MTIAALSAESGPFDTISGLPVHPLVVHGAVVLLPLGALGVLALLLVPRWRGKFGWLVLAGLAAGAAAAVIAEKSGEALAARVGMPREHAEWGERLPIVAVLTLIVSLAWFLLAQRAVRARAAAAGGGATGGGSATVRVGGILSGLLALATLGATVLVGHSGATAVWSGKIAATNASGATGASAGTPTPKATSAAAVTTSASGGGPAAGSYTTAQVATHNTKDSCWAVVNGGVYDLTSWIDRHPGGDNVIKALCGTDGTAAFTAQHGSAAKAANQLAQFKIGTLG
jgi:uncharacterized membrane protein